MQNRATNIFKLKNLEKLLDNRTNLKGYGQKSRLILSLSKQSIFKRFYQG